MNSDKNSSALHEVERLIKQLDNKIRSQKIRASEQLIEKKIYPNLISDPGIFLQNIITPILIHFSDDTENVRENCVLCITSYLKQLGNTNLIDTLTYVLPPLLARLKSDVEPAEQIQLRSMKLLLNLIDLVSPASYPSSWDNFVIPMEPVLRFSFKSNDAKMKRISCQVLDSVIKKSSSQSIQPLGGLLMKVILPNCVHRHNEVRKCSLRTLAKLLIASGYYEDIDKVFEVLQKLIEDHNDSVRKEIIHFCRKILVKHPMRHVMYHPLMIPLFYYVTPIVPKRPIFIDTPIKNDESTEEATLAFDALVAIGKQHEEDKEDDMKIELQYFENEKFDETGREIPRGLVHIIQDLFPKWMNYLVPMISDWTETKRMFSYLSMRSILHISFGYSTRYVPQIIRSTSISLRDFKNEYELSLQLIAILSSNVPASDIISILVPQLTNDGPKQILMILTTTIINSKPTYDDLITILNTLKTAGTYQAIESIDYLTQLIISMIRKSENFVDNNSVSLLYIIFKICENSDAMKYFMNSFSRPISEIISNNFTELLKTIELTPSYVYILLDNTPTDAILGSIKEVEHILLKIFESNSAKVHITKELTTSYMFFEGVDFTNFWNDCEYALNSLVCDPPSDELIESIEKELGYKLPASYIWLMKQHNGGIPVNTCFPTKTPTTWAKDHVAISDIMAISREKSFSICGKLGSQFMIDEWKYPPIGVAVCNCPSAGHDMIFLDYRECGPQGEPKVVHIDQEVGYIITPLADSFEDFVRGLVNESNYQYDSE
ncbi:SMI1/KNR4 family protein [Histomonas meleagridis]|uniref:SMI1/KNR4 family protein n=1 Tax=Histomonas meleagridis TaxID=135588 RepID=UPI003559F3C3|nr:SMI1/KNR4 family protein [Histomonas meleagridis]KAH0798362.1 SMI1/KNR4 family protein [Histomonas meleagridis]